MKIRNNIKYVKIIIGIFYIYTMQLYKIISIMLIDKGCHEILTRKNKITKWYVVWIDEPHSFHFEPSWLKVQRSNRIIIIQFQRREWCGMHILNVKKEIFKISFVHIPIVNVFQLSGAWSCILGRGCFPAHFSLRFMLVPSLKQITFFLPNVQCHISPEKTGEV